jgi:NADH-quinone oxidoreductase subunit E
MQLSAEEREHVRAVVDAILKEQENVRENLIPVLQQVQARLGYLPGPAIRQIAAGRRGAGGGGIRPGHLL